jgi:hypothetical protein
MNETGGLAMWFNCRNIRRELARTINARLAAWCLLAATAASACGAENMLRDANFGRLGRADSAWQVAAQEKGKAEPARAADGKTPAVRLKAAATVEQVTLGGGLYELTVDARGHGELLLGVSDAGERSQVLGEKWGTYGYLFEAGSGTKTVTIRAVREGTVTAAAIRLATAGQKAAWQKAADVYRQFGLSTFSAAQRPAPGGAELGFQGEVKLLSAMTKRVVLDDPRLDTAHMSVESATRLTDWLGENGFTRLNSEALAAWMRARIAAGDCYGSVAVLSRGMSPSNLLEGPREQPLWLEYLRGGGRIVNVGCYPLYLNQSPTARPPLRDAASRGLAVFGFHLGWDSPYWGQGLRVTRNPAAKGWGLEGLGPSSVGLPVESVTLAFGLYTVPNLGKQGAADWFKNVRPDMPWSGVVTICWTFNANSAAQMRDIWRAAHYVGRPVVVPPLPSQPAVTPPRLQILAAAGGIEGRHEFVRGEEMQVQLTADDSLEATAVRLELLQGARTLLAEVQPAKGASFTVKTGPFADGDYALRAAALKGQQVLATHSENIGIRYLPPKDFHFEVSGRIATNLRRAEIEIADIRDAGMEPHAALPTAAELDVMVRNHVGFSLRDMPAFFPPRTTVTFDKNPQYYRLDNEGKPMGNPYTAGRPGLGISHPEIMENCGKSIAAQIKAVAALPSFRPYALCNDDWSIYYGWDYAPHVLAAFKADTGRDAPRKMELPPACGAIPDDHPWLQWFQWTLVHVDGAYNKAETQAATKARADVRIGPIPGGMQIPLVMLWQPAQYPTYSFGVNGFNLICSYYYNTYWQPVLTDTFWMEIGRMGNRGLPEWNMPDVFMTAGYTRNNLFHYLAGGIQGLAYYTYSERTESAWGEIGRLGKVVRRIGPVQARLAPARRDIGMLNSFTTNCFDPSHTCQQAYGYHNLLQGHFDVEMVSEDEIVAGRAPCYKAVLLYNVKYLRRTVYDALAVFAARGGLVILDTSVPFEIPGAKRLAVDVGMGRQKTLPVSPRALHLSTPGIRDYGHADRIEVIREALSQYVKPRFDCPDIKLVASRFEAGGVPYTWFVNAHDGQEYMFCRERMGAGHPGAGTPEKVKELIDWETAETAKGPYVATAEFDQLAGVPYDLVGGRQVPVAKTASGRYAITLSMQRFGGALVAWLPGRIASVKLSSPATAAANHPVRFQATVSSQDHPTAGAIAVEFALRDPAGRPSIVSGVRATSDGQAVFDWTPAVNDPPGPWTLEATELASGKEARSTIDLTQ